MTVSSTASRVVYQGDGSTTSWPFAFKVQQAADLVVVYSDALGNDFALSPAQFSATGLGLAAGGTVIYPLSGSPIAAGTRLTIYRDVLVTQPTSINNQGALWPAVIEAALDRLTFIAQKIADQLSRTVSIGPTDGQSLNLLPNATQRANSVLGFDSNGQPYAAQAFSGSGSASSWMIANFLPQTSPAAAAIAIAAPFVVPTLADLKALTARPAVVAMAGRGAVNDGGGGRFVWLANDGTAADDALVVQCGSGPAGRYKRVYDGAIDARWFGYLADGSTDNTTSLRNAIAAAVALNGELRLPPGTALAGPLTIAGTCQIRGSGGGTILKPAAGATSPWITIAASRVKLEELKLDASALATPGFVVVTVNTSGGIDKMEDLEIVGGGVALSIPSCNAGRFTNLRLQAQTAACVQTGGAAGSFPGDLTWTECVLIPAAGAVGFLADGNSNAQYLTRVQIIGGLHCLWLRGAGAGTNLPDGFFLTTCNLTGSSGAVVRISKCRNFNAGGDGVFAGSTGGDGILIDAVANGDVDGVNLDDCQIRANFMRGVNWQGGANLSLTNGQCHGNNDGPAFATYSNVVVGAAAVGLFRMHNVMAGLSKSGEIYGNIAASAKFGVELASGALTDAADFPGRVIISGNVLDGNATGDISDGSAPAGHRKLIANNMLAS